MKIIYKTDTVELQCTSVKAARKRFGGDKKIAEKLLSAICSIESAKTLKDIWMNPRLRLHPLHDKKRKKLKGYFAIDVNGQTDKWRVILRPLDENEEPYTDYRLDVKSEKTINVEVVEVSKHYE